MQHVPSSAPLCPWLPLPALLPPGDVATTAVAPGKGEVVLKTEGQSHQQWVPGYPRSPVSCTSPLSLLLSAVTLLPESGTAPACQGALPQCLPCLGFCLPRSSYSGSAIPVGAGAGERSCRAAPALTGPGVCYSWPCPVLRIAPALRKGAVSPVWVCSVPVGLEGGKVAHFPSSTAVHQPGISEQDSPVPAGGAPHSPGPQQSGQLLWGTTRAWCWHRGLAGPARLGQGRGLCPGSGGRGGTPTLAPPLLRVHLPSSCGARCYATAGS